MLTPTELRELWRDLAGTRVLSVYLDTWVTDPAMREAWRPALTSAIRAAGAGITDPEDRARFERAAATLRDPSPPPGGVYGAPGWVAFATEDGIRFAGDLPVRPTPLAVWRDGPVVAPYVRALKQHRPVIIALVESRHAKLCRYAQGRLERLADLVIQGEEEVEGGVAGSPPPRGSGQRAPRSDPGSEALQRRRVAAFQRAMPELAQRIEEHAGDDGWVLIGGTPPWEHHAFEALRKQFEGRLRVEPALHTEATDAQLVRAAKDAATELRGAHGRVLVHQLLDRASGNSRAEVGVPGVQRALVAGAVDLLLVSPTLISTEEALAEQAVRAAIEQGADVEVPSGDAAEELDRVAAGMAARLRFPIDRPAYVEQGTAPTAAPPGA